MRNGIPTRTIVQKKRTTTVSIPNEMMKHIIGTERDSSKKIQELFFLQQPESKTKVALEQTAIEITGTEKATEDTKKVIKDNPKKGKRC